MEALLEGCDVCVGEAIGRRGVVSDVNDLRRSCLGKGFR